MAKYLLSLDQKEFLVKTLLNETIFEDNIKEYSCNLSKRVIHIGIADTESGLEKLPIKDCNVAEIYIRDFPAFDFSILSEEDFHDENHSFVMLLSFADVVTPNGINQFYGRKGSLVCRTGESGLFGLNVESSSTDLFYSTDITRVIGSLIYDQLGNLVRDTAVNDWSGDSSQIYIMSPQGRISVIKLLGQDC